MAIERIELHPEAFEEAEAALRWYLERSSRAGKAFLAELVGSVKTVSETPDRWPLFVAGTRRYP